MFGPHAERVRALEEAGEHGKFASNDEFEFCSEVQLSGSPFRSPVKPYGGVDLLYEAADYHHVVVSAAVPGLLELERHSHGGLLGPVVRTEACNGGVTFGWCRSMGRE